MSYFLIICFTVLVVCIVLQTLMMYKQHKNIDFDYNDTYKRHLTRIYSENNEIFVTTDSIVGINLNRLQDNKYNIVINCDNIDFVENYNSEEEAWNRINELFDIIENE